MAKMYQTQPMPRPTVRPAMQKPKAPPTIDVRNPQSMMDRRPQLLNDRVPPRLMARPALRKPSR